MRADTCANASEAAAANRCFVAPTLDSRPTNHPFVIFVFIHSIALPFDKQLDNTLNLHPIAKIRALSG